MLCYTFSPIPRPELLPLYHPPPPPSSSSLSSSKSPPFPCPPPPPPPPSASPPPSPSSSRSPPHSAPPPPPPPSSPPFLLRLPIVLLPSRSSRTKEVVHVVDTPALEGAACYPQVQPAGSQVK